MYLHDSDERRVEVVRLCLLRVEDVYRVRPAGDGEDRLGGEGRREGRRGEGGGEGGTVNTLFVCFYSCSCFRTEQHGTKVHWTSTQAQLTHYDSYNPREYGSIRYYATDTTGASGCSVYDGS